MAYIKTALQVKTIGSILKEKRKEKKLTLEKISDDTKIRTVYLKALEDGDYAKFSSEVYLKGFLKNYAKYLDVNTEKALALYRRENERKQISNQKKDKNFLNKRVLNLNSNTVVIILSVLAVLFILLYLASYIGKVVKEPKLEITSPISLLQEYEGSYKTDANFITISGSAELGSTLTINDQELKLNSFEKFTQNFNLEEGKNTFSIKAESQFGKIKEIVLTIFKEEGVDEKIKLNMDITITKDNSEVHILVDDKEFINKTYNKDSSISITADKKIEIITNRPSSLDIVLNGTKETITKEKSVWNIVNKDLIRY